MEKYRKLFSNTAIFAASNVLSKLILSLLLPLYTRVLTSSEYGTTELVTTITQLIIPICSLAIQDSIFRFSMDKDRHPSDVLRSSGKVVLIACILLGIVSSVLLFYEPVHDWVLYLWIISVVTMVRSIMSLYIKAIDKTLIFSIDNVIYNLSLALLNVFLLTFCHLKVEGYFIALILANIISIIYLGISGDFLSQINSGKNDRNLLKDMIGYSSPLILNSISWGITHLVDKVMLTNHIGTSATGIYSAASKIPSLLSLVTGVFTQAWTLSAISDYQQEKDKTFYMNIFNLTHLGLLFAALIIFILNNSFLAFVLGKDFSEAVDYVPVLLVGTVFLTYSNFFSPIYSAMKMSKQIMVSSFIGMIINVLLNVILIPYYGIMGACLATSISYVFIGVFRIIDCNRLFPIEIDFNRFSLSIFILFICCLSSTVNKYVLVICGFSVVLLIFLYWRNILFFSKKIVRSIK